MNFRRVLCPIDFSRFSKAANYYASLFADSGEAELVFLAVNDEIPGEGQFEKVLDDLFTKLTNDVRPFVPGIKHRYLVHHGDPATEILKAVDSQDVDLVVMGTHGKTGFSRLLFGSVAAKVLRNAKCPVMVVKDKLNVDWILPGESFDSQIAHERQQHVNRGKNV